MALLATLRLWYVAPLFAGLVVTSLGAAHATLGGVRSAVNDERAPSWSLFDIALVLLLAIFATLNLLGTQIPEIFYDSLTYHLALPDLYWRRHGFYGTPDNVFSGVPLLIQMLFAVALPIGGETLAHLIHWVFGLSGALLAYGCANRLAGHRAGLLAALFYYSNPLVGVMSWKAGVDLGTSFYLLLAVYALGMAYEDKQLQREWLTVSGAMCGFTMGTKYQAWPLAGVLAALIAWESGKDALRNTSAMLRSVAPFFISLLASFAIWPLRNLFLYGNPVYPMFQENFTSWGTRIDWRALLRDGGRDAVAALSTMDGFVHLLKSPWHLSTQQNDTTMFGPVFLLGLPLLLVYRPERRVERVIRAAMLALWAVWSLTTYLPRYFLPTFLVATILFAVSTERVFSANGKKFAYPLILVVLVTNFFWTATWFHVYEANAVVMGLESREDYLKRPHPSYGAPYFACAEFINRNTPRDARILIVADERGYYVNRDREAASIFGEHILNRYVRESPTPIGLRDRFLADGFTHVLFNAGKLKELGTTHWFKFSPAEASVYDRFSQKYLKQTYESYVPPAAANLAPTWCAVYEVLR